MDTPPPGYHNLRTVDIVGQCFTSFLVGILVCAIVVNLTLPETSTNEPLYRKHMIRNNLAEWVINQDGKNVLVLKGIKDYEKWEKSK